MRIRARNLARDWAADPTRCQADLTEAMQRGRDNQPGGLTSNDFSIRDLATEFIRDRNGDPVGGSFVEEVFNPSYPNSLQEAMSAVDSTAFANITGQIVFNSILQGYQAEEFVASRLVSTIPTKLSGEKIPGVAKLTDAGDDLIVREGQPYPHYGFGEEYVETPITTKRGLVVPVTKEAIYFDRTGLITRRAAEVGQILGLNKEKRLLDVIIGATNTYQEKRADDSSLTARDTYQTATPWINDFLGTDLVDWTQVDDAEQAFADLLDPNTGEPIVMGGRQLFTVPQKRATVMRILSATEVRETTNTNTVTNSANPLNGLGITPANSRLLYRRLMAADGLGLPSYVADGVWFYGDFAKAFAYMENWPITVMQSPLNSEAEFNQDIVLRYKSSEMGVAAVIEPRAIQRRIGDTSSSSSGA